MTTDRPSTAFEERVYEAVRMIPRGMVTTYATIGKIIHCRSAQAIGQALKRNPNMPEVPCHRVIRTDLTLGGYGGETGGAEEQRKLALLKAEGVRFIEGRLAEPERCWVGE
jgi:methylated-DNA-[protein]-cysteine S-methyltransferase